MRENNPLKPGTPAFSAQVQNKMVNWMPLVCLVVGILIIASQYAKRNRIYAELISAQKEYKQLEKRMQELQKPPS